MGNVRAKDYFVGNEDLLDAVQRERHNIYESRLLLLHRALTTKDPGRVLSIGAGAGTYEYDLEHRFNIHIDVSLEPSAGFVASARSKGLTVIQAGAQDYDYPHEAFDTIMYNGSGFGFIEDDELEPTFRRNVASLRPGGRLILQDVPEESALGILLKVIQEYPQIAENRAYRELLDGTVFYDLPPYKPYWHPTRYYIDLLGRIGLGDFEFLQTVLANPPYENEQIEQPIEGYEKGSYIAIIAHKPQ